MLNSGEQSIYGVDAIAQLYEEYNWASDVPVVYAEEGAETGESASRFVVQGVDIYNKAAPAEIRAVPSSLFSFGHASIGQSHNWMSFQQGAVLELGIDSILDNVARRNSSNKGTFLPITARMWQDGAQVFLQQMLPYELERMPIHLGVGHINIFSFPSVIHYSTDANWHEPGAIDNMILVDVREDGIVQIENQFPERIGLELTMATQEGYIIYANEQGAFNGYLDLEENRIISVNGINQDQRFLIITKDEVSVWVVDKLTNEWREISEFDDVRIIRGIRFKIHSWYNRIYLSMNVEREVVRDSNLPNDLFLDSHETDIQRVEAAIDRRENVNIIGRPGSGKTTLWRMLLEGNQSYRNRPVISISAGLFAGMAGDQHTNFETALIDLFYEDWDFMVEDGVERYTSINQLIENHGLIVFIDELTILYRHLVGDVNTNEQAREQAEQQVNFIRRLARDPRVSIVATSHMPAERISPAFEGMFQESIVLERDFSPEAIDAAELLLRETRRVQRGVHRNRLRTINWENGLRNGPLRRALTEGVETSRRYDETPLQHRDRVLREAWQILERLGQDERREVSENARRIMEGVREIREGRERSSGRRGRMHR